MSRGGVFFVYLFIPTVKVKIKFPAFFLYFNPLVKITTIILILYNKEFNILRISKSYLA